MQTSTQLTDKNSRNYQLASVEFKTNQRLCSGMKDSLNNLLSLLPKDILTHVFTSWITLGDIAKLDSACCNNKIRADLLKIMYDSCSFYSPML